jgi:hypothetical protein
MKFMMFCASSIGCMFLCVGCSNTSPDAPKSQKKKPDQRVETSTGTKDAPASRQKKKPASTTGQPSTSTSDPDPNLMEWNQRLTAVRKIRAGMTIEQVEGILGIADENTEDNDPTGILEKRGITLSILTWRGDDPGENGDFIIIAFENQRLKETSQIKVNASRR